MIFRLLKTSVSMLGSSNRMTGRGWLTELAVRAARDVFIQSQKKGLPWLRETMKKSAGYHPALARVSCHSRELAGVPCMMVSPKTGVNSDKVIVYLHGGGYTSGSPESHKTILAQMALDSQGLVVAPDYRLAPEHPFPAPQDDCLAVTALVLKTYDDKKVTLAGDSAGGALAVATSLELAQGEHRQVDNLVLISPWVDPSADGGSIITNDKNDFISGEFLSDSIEALMQERDQKNPKINFLDVSLADLPRTLVQYGKGEIFQDQIVEFSERAKAQGVDLELQGYRAQFHVFHLFSALLKDAEDALKKIGKFISQR